LAVFIDIDKLLVLLALCENNLHVLHINCSDMFNNNNDLYASTADVLISCAKSFVHERCKDFYKFWWDQD